MQNEALEDTVMREMFRREGHPPHTEPRIIRLRAHSGFVTKRVADAFWFWTTEPAPGTGWWGWRTVVSQAIQEAFKNQLRSVTGVEGFFWKQGGPGEAVAITTVIEATDFDLQDRIYQAEQRLMEAFPDASFDFGVAFRGRLGIADLARAGAVFMSV